MVGCYIVRSGGQKQHIKYGDNIFDFNDFKTKLSSFSDPVYHGTIVWLDNGFTLNATGEDCYTLWQWSNVPTIEVKRNTAYELSFDVNGFAGYNYIFFEYPATTNKMIMYSNHQTQTYFCTLYDTTKIVLRFGVEKSGTSCTFTNIKLRQFYIT